MSKVAQSGYKGVVQMQNKKTGQMRGVWVARYNRDGKDEHVASASAPELAAYAYAARLLPMTADNSVLSAGDVAYHKAELSKIRAKGARRKQVDGDNDPLLKDLASLLDDPSFDADSFFDADLF